jgi:hypothetical protein
MSFCAPHVGQGQVSVAGPAPSCGRATAGPDAVTGSGVGARKEVKH